MRFRPLLFLWMSFEMHDDDLGWEVPRSLRSAANHSHLGLAPSHSQMGLAWPHPRRDQA